MTYTVQRTGQGRRIELGPNEIVIRLTGAETDGAFSLCEYITPPDGPSPPRHAHEATDEGFVVLDEVLECTVENDSIRAEEGDTVFDPQGTPHTFSAVGTAPARFLLTYSPAGFEGYFEDMGEFLASLPPGPRATEQVQQRAAELSEVFDQTVVDTGG